MRLSNIRDIIFDLGGVIIGLDTSRTVSEMAKLINASHSEALSIFESDQRFKDYETGKITDHEFRDFIRELTTKKLTDSMIDFAWNAMILDIPDHHFNLLLALKETHRVHLLSNTNSIHIYYVNSKLMAGNNGSFSQYFHTEYYSHKLGMRKPNVDIFEHVLQDGDMEANSTLFLDDNLDNLAGAQRLGINVYHVQKLTDTAEFFNER